MKSALDIFLASIVALCLSTLVYGLVSFPDAPIRRCGANQFCGKWNKLHTEREYEDFIAWERALFFSFPFGLGASALLARRRRRRASQRWERLSVMQRDLSPAIEERRYAAAWRDLRRRDIAARVSFVLALSSAGWIAWVADGGFVAAVLPIALFALAAGSSLWFLFFRCPRCDNQVFTRQSRDRCPRCNLRIGATFEEGLAELP